MGKIPLALPLSSQPVGKRKVPVKQSQRWIPEQWFLPAYLLLNKEMSSVFSSLYHHPLPKPQTFTISQVLWTPHNNLSPGPMAPLRVLLQATPLPTVSHHRKAWRVGPRFSQPEFYCLSALCAVGL